MWEECHGGDNQQFRFDASTGTFHHGASGKKFATDCGGKEEAADDEQEEKEDEVTPVMEPHIVGDAELSSTRCKGKPLTGWKGLGKKVSEAACQEACLASTPCAFAVWKQNKKKKDLGDCAEMSSCSGSTTAKGKVFYKVWRKLVSSEHDGASKDRIFEASAMSEWLLAKSNI